MARPPKAKAIERLRRSLDAIPELKQLPHDSPKFEKWQRDTRVAMGNIFGENSKNTKEFERISYHPGVYYPDMPDSDFQERYVSGLDSAAAMLESMIEEVEEYWEDDKQAQISSSAQENDRPRTNEVFVIHGRDEGTKEKVARFLQTLGLEPVILHEQANLGRTIIEKFEDYAHVGFAVALLTPDDAGSLQGEENSSKPRARQNVIFEFGYFIGKLGRERVCALVKGDVEKPSDYDGVLYISLNDPNDWKIELIKELKAAGINVDANRAFSS